MNQRGLRTPPHVSDAAKSHYASLEATSFDGIDPRTEQGAQMLRAIAYPRWRAAQEAMEKATAIERASVAGLNAGWIRSSDLPNETVLLHLHGGGYVLGDVDVRAAVALGVVGAGGASALTIGYRLAPEHPFPAALDDAISAYRYLLDIGYAPERIGVLGESAGGGLALALAVSVRERGLPMFGATALVSPWTDLCLSGDSMTTLAEADPHLHSNSLLTGLAAAYAKDHPRDHPLVSPLYADLVGLPPMLIQAGAREVFLSDALGIARNARNAGVDVILDVWDGLWHVFHDQVALPEARTANAEIAQFFRARLRYPGFRPADTRAPAPTQRAARIQFTRRRQSTILASSGGWGSDDSHSSIRLSARSSCHRPTAS